MTADETDIETEAPSEAPAENLEETKVMLLSGVEQAILQLASAIEKKEMKAPQVAAPQVSVSPQIHVPPAKDAPAHKGWKFTFHRDDKGRIASATATPLP